MRVALDYRPALFSRSGIARATRELALALVAAGETELHLFGHGWKRPLDTTAPGRARLHRMRLPGRALPALAWLGLDSARLAGNAKVFHWTDYVFPPVRRGASAPRIVQTVHDLAFLEESRFHGDVGSQRLTTRFRSAMARADLLVCPSRATEAALARHFPVRAPTRVIPFGVDHVHRASPCAVRGRQTAAKLLGADRPYIVALATLEPRKNHEQLLAALDLLADRGHAPALVCIGQRGWETTCVERRLGTRHPAYPCAWVRDRTDTEVFDLVAGARALVYPTSLEGFGFPPLEALELGVPVIVGRCAATLETCGDAALFVDGMDPRSIAAAITRLDRETGLGPALVARWQPRRAAFCWQRCADAHRAAYQDVAARSMRQ